MTDAKDTPTAPSGDRQLLRQFLALLSPFVAFVVQWIFGELNPYVWLLFYPAVFVSSWIGGRRAGVISAVISTALVWYFFVPPAHSVTKDPRQFLPAVIFFTMGVFFSVFHDRLRKANEQAAVAVAAESAKQEISRLYEKMKNITELRTRFFANVSHELRTPLALIIGPTERLLRASDTPGAARRDLNVVARNARTLLGYVNNLLDIAKLGAGGIKLDYAETDVSRLARFVAGHFEVLSKDKGIALQVEAPATLSAQVDPAKVQRILSNLLANTFKFTPAGGRARLTVRETAERVSFEVADSGPGIPPDKREAVFERFRQLEGGVAGHPEGTGLGLSIVREFTLLHGGSSSVSEAPEGGALFVVELPRAAPHGAVVRPMAEGAAEAVEVRQAVEEVRALSATVEPSMGAAGALVLVVEDNPEMNRFVSENLAVEHRIAVAFDGKEGLEKAKALKPDLILSDIMMPEMSGEELVHEVRRCPDLDATPIILLTAKADDELCVRLLREGAQDYLMKPVSIEELRARVSTLVSKKLADELVRQAEAKFRGIVSIAADAIISIDEEQRIALYNEGAEEAFGWSRDEVIGKPLDILLPARFRDIHRQHVRNFAAGDLKARRMGEARTTLFGLRKNGQEFPAQAAISKLRVGDAWMFTVILRDITEHKRIEKEEKFLAEVGSVLASTLDYEETPYNVARLVVRELADVCIVETLEEEGQLVRLKVAYRDPGMASVADVLQRIQLDRGRPHLGSSVLDSKQPLVMSEVTPEYLESIAQSGEYRRALGELAPKSVMALPLLAHGRLVGVMVLVSATDVRRYTTEDLPLAQEVARRAALAVENARLYRTSQRAVQARDNVFGIVAHDLRNPLSTIVMQANLLRRHGQEAERRSRKPADAIERAATRMHRLIQDLLDVARMEGGRLAVEQARVSAREVLSDLLEAQRPLASSASLELRVDAPRDLPDVWADRDRLLQVFENLIGNAIKFTPAGGQIVVGAAHSRGEVLFWVTDTGAGIPAENLPHIFERFWQARTAERRGAGLGLPIVKGIVEVHGGRIWVESTPGRGSTFFFTIPVAARPEQWRGEPAPHGP